MLERFQGKRGRAILVEALRRQQIIEGQEEVASELANLARVKSVAPCDELTTQGASDNAIYFLLTGRVSIVVNGRQIAVRTCGQHVGEMALIDPTAPRSASVIALEEVVVARVPEPEFTRFANTHPRVWRLLAVELCSRLRQRNGLIRAPNPRPVLFIGSSTESLLIARYIYDRLRQDNMDVLLWTENVFGPSSFLIESLERVMGMSDAAALIIGPDDRVISRGTESSAPRDNVLFELGMSFGALSRRRTFLVRPRDVEVKIPTDLLGVIPLEFDPDGPDKLDSICTELRRAIQDLGCR